jgi:hypothetical protein
MPQLIYEGGFPNIGYGVLDVFRRKSVKPEVVAMVWITLSPSGNGRPLEGRCTRLENISSRSGMPAQSALTAEMRRLNSYYTFSHWRRSGTVDQPEGRTQEPTRSSSCRVEKVGYAKSSPTYMERLWGLAEGTMGMSGI